MAKKRLAILTLSASEPRLMLAGVDNGQLHIVKCERLERSLLALKRTLPEKLEKLKAAGFILLVDEVIPTFAKYGRAVRLADLDAAGRPVIVSAMEAYNNLTALGAITYPVGAGGHFDVSSSVVDEVRGRDGKAAYNIDWSELRPETHALILAVYAATQETLLDTSTLKHFLSLVGGKPKQPTPASRAAALFKARTQIIADDPFRKGVSDE